MSYVCPECGNKRRFIQINELRGRCWYTSKAKESIDGETEDVLDTLDEFDYDYDDYEYNSTDEYGDIECDECGNNAITVDEEDWERWEEGKSEEEQEGWNQSECCFEEKPKENKGAISEMKKSIFGEEKKGKTCKHCGKEEIAKKYYLCPQCGEKL